jgi:hypothetical protein
MTSDKSVRAEFQVASWDEKPYAEFEDKRKLTQAITTQNYAGGLVGEGRSNMVMCYGDSADVPVYYTGLEHFTGSLDGRSGTFVMQAKGVFADGIAASTWFVVPGSGTGELAGLSGEGETRAVHGESAIPVTFEYHFEA